MNIRNLFQNKSNTNQAFWVGIGSLSTFALALLSTAILSRFLIKSEYGTYRQIIYVYNTLLVVFTAGLPRVFNYFLPRYTLEQGREIVMKISKVLLLAGFFFSLFLFLSSGLIAEALKNPELEKGLKIFSPVPMLLLPTLGIEGIFSTYKRTKYIALYNTLTRALMLVFIVSPVIFLEGNYLSAIYGWIASSFIILIVAYFFKGIPFRGTKPEKSGLTLREVFQYSLPLVAASIAGIVFRAANQFYISRFFGPEVFAEFSNGFIEIPFVTMITGASSTVLMPIFSKIIHEEGDVSEIVTLWRSTLQKSAILIYPIVIYFMFYSKEFVTIVFSEVYSVSAIYFSIAMILNFFNIIVFAPLLLALGESRFYARLHLGLALVTWLVEYVVILIFNSPVAVAISFVTISIGGIFVSIWFSAKTLNIKFFKLFPILRFLVVAFHSFISLFLVNTLFSYLLPHSGDLLFVAVAGTAYLGVLMLSSRWFQINYLQILRPLL